MICPTSKKRYFRTKAEAKAYMKKHAAYFSTVAVKIYIYHCTCQGFHLTSSPPCRVKVKRAAADTLVLTNLFKKLLK